jgi:general stress protein YciG
MMDDVKNRPKDQAAVALGRKGGLATMRKLGKEARAELARKGGLAAGHRRKKVRP